MDEIHVKKKLFGSEITFIIYNTEEVIAKELIEEAYEEGIRLQKIFNFFDEKSSLSLLNRKRKMKMPEEFIEVLKLSLEMCKETNGLYDISLGKQFLERKKGKEISKINCSYKDIEVNEGVVELKNKDVLIDLGSIAKGYITDRMAKVLEENGVLSGLIDSRGDIRVFGKRGNKISIQHPRNKEKVIGKVKIRNSGIATSGDYNQYDKSFDKSHILNQSDAISVTVVAPTLMEADVYATALFVCTKKERDFFIKKNKNLKVLIMKKDLKLVNYNNFQELFYE
jgi:thiamine biosynthesis lipoprotein